MERRLKVRLDLSLACHDIAPVLTCPLSTEWQFDFGFVIPGSTNSWENTIDAAEQKEMLPAAVLSGNLVIDTSFYDGDVLIGTSSCTVYYE
jgi:retinal rod rhodopsin-sensitive cGMP 3',5'-cyclic phosphodiesterase subunit delta